MLAWRDRWPGGGDVPAEEQLEDENARLKRLVADLTLDKHMLSEALRKNA
jgi:putative transposase